MPKSLPKNPLAPRTIRVVVLAHFEQLAVRVNEVEGPDEQAISATAQVAQFPRRGSFRGHQRRHAQLNPEGLLAEQPVAVTQTHEPIAAAFLICWGIRRVGVELSTASQSIGL
jgi:hypothetical protein